jgi:hypothetical protein
MKTIYLVTGAAGFMGTNVCAQLLERGDAVRAFVLKGDPAVKFVPKAVEIFEGDLCSAEDCEKFFAVEPGTQTVCIHCASMVTINPNYSEKLFAVNVGGAGAGNIDELFALRVIFGGIQHIFCAAHIDGDEFFTVIRVDRHHARAVDADGLCARFHGKEFLAVLGTAEVTLKDFDGLRHKFYGGVALQYKSAHGITALQELCADISAHKSGSTGDKIDGFHSCILRFPVGCFLFRCS